MQADRSGDSSLEMDMFMFGRRGLVLRAEDQQIVYHYLPAYGFR